MRLAKVCGSSSEKPEVSSEVSINEQGQVLDGPVVLVRVGPAAQLLDDRVGRVDLQDILGRHVARHGRVPQGLRLHDALHAGGPASVVCPQLPSHV